MQCTTEEKDGVHIVHLPQVVDVKDAGAMDAQVKTWLVSKCGVHLIDFRDVKEFRNSAYRYFVIFNQALKSNNKMMFAMNISTQLVSQLRQDGLTDVFVSANSVEEAKRKSQPSKLTVDVEFINPFIMAAKTVLETQAQLKLTPGKAYLRKSSENIPMEIAGVINLVCPDFKGSISLCFKAEVFLKIYEQMVGEKHTVINNEIQDAAGELLNMMFGQAKTVLNDEKGYQLQKAIPTILVGEKLRLHHQSRVPAIVIPFDSVAGAFHLEIVVDRV